MKPLPFAIALAVAALGAGCGEKPQTAAASGPVKRADTDAWHGADPRFVAAGWKSGDRASWDAQLRQRAQTQNEYLRLRP